MRWIVLVEDPDQYLGTDPEKVEARLNGSMEMYDGKRVYSFSTVTLYATDDPVRDRIEALETEIDAFVDDALTDYDPETVDKDDIRMERANWAEQNPNESAELALLRADDTVS